MARETINGISVPIPGTGEPADFQGDLRRMATELSATYVREGSAFADLSKQVGVDPTGGTECGAAIQTALDSFAAFGVRAYARGGSVFNTSSTLTITNSCDLSDAFVNYSGAGVAVQIGSNGAVTRRKKFSAPSVVYTPKVSNGWTAGTVGVRTVNLSDCQVQFANINNFETGHLVYAANNENAYNTFYMAGLNNNKRNQVIDADATGYCNQNTFIGGRYSHNSGEGTQVAGVVHIYLADIVTSRPNGNLWLGCSLESPNVVQYAVDIESGVSNRFVQCRFEDTSNLPRFRLGPKCVSPEIEGGFGADSIVWTQVAGSSPAKVITPARMVFAGSALPMMRLENASSSSNIALALYNAGTIGGTTPYVPNTEWTVALAATFFKMKNKADAFERVRIDQGGGGAGGGLVFGSGAVDADVNLYRSAANVLKTDDKLLAVGGLGVGNSLAATTPGTVVRKIEVFDAAGASLGFVPVYGAIT